MAQSATVNTRWSGLHSGRLRERLATLVLFATLVRALVPVGFMPMAHDGQTHMMFCPGHMASAPQGQADPSGSAPAAKEQPCSYAVSAGAAPVVAAIDLNLGYAAPSFARSVLPANPTVEPPRRYAAPRGPPLRG